MRRFNFMMLLLNAVALLLAPICSAVGLVSYVAAQGPADPALSATTPAPLPAATASPSPTPEPTPTLSVEEKRGQYYRGMFDICVASGRNSPAPKEQIIENCRKLVRLAMEQKWFEAPSKEWHWPLSEGLLDNFEQMNAY